MAKTKESFSSVLNTFIMNGFVKTFNNETDNVWKPLSNYKTGDTVTHSVTEGFTSINSQYVALNDGKSGTNPPIHTEKGKVASDGNVRWMYLSSAVSSANLPTNLYLTFGKPDNWKDENEPDEALTTVKASVDVINNIIYARKVGKDAISLVIDRNTWQHNKIFEDFHIDKTDYQHPHYTTNNQGFLYYCLYSNNSSPSTIEPTGEGTQPINMLDGYIWLYAGRVENINTNRFVTDDYIPINRSLIINPYIGDNQGGFASLDLSVSQRGNFEATDELEYLIKTGNETEFKPNPTVQFSAIRNTAGVIEKVEIQKTGKDFDYPAQVIIRKKNETGKDAAITLEIENGKIKNPVITNPGSGYANGAVAIVKGGKGTDALLKLSVSTQGKVVDAVIENEGQGYTEIPTVFIISGKAGKVCDVSLLPKSLSPRNVIKTLGEADLMISLELSPSNEYFNYDVDFREVCLIANLQDKQTDEELNAHEAIGAKHNDYSSSTTTLKKLKTEEGLVLYRMNTTKIKHTQGQTEKYKLTIEG